MGPIFAQLSFKFSEESSSGVKLKKFVPDTFYDKFEWEHKKLVP